MKLTYLPTYLPTYLLTCMLTDYSIYIKTVIWYNRIPYQFNSSKDNSRVEEDP